MSSLVGGSHGEEQCSFIAHSLSLSSDFNEVKRDKVGRAEMSDMNRTPLKIPADPSPCLVDPRGFRTPPMKWVVLGSCWRAAVVCIVRAPGRPAGRAKLNYRPLYSASFTRQTRTENPGLTAAIHVVVL